MITCNEGVGACVDNDMIAIISKILHQVQCQTNAKVTTVYTEIHECSNYQFKNKLIVS